MVLYKNKYGINCFKYRTTNKDNASPEIES